MNCDHVFEVLTRGPFPSGDPSDQAVEAHLAGCHDCRRLAEALRPALDLFHESLADERTGLPGYLGEQTRGQETVTTAVMEQIRQTAEPVAAPAAPAPMRPHSGLMQLIAAAFIGLALSASLLAISRRDHEPEELQVATKPSVLDSSAQRRLASMKLAISCASYAQPGKVARDYKCCTLCHAAGRDKSTPIPAMLRVVSACKTCHLEKSLQ